MTVQTPPHDRERGAILVHVVIGIIAFMAFSTFVVDYGTFWLSRRQAQNAADSGALAGASSLAFDDYQDRSTTGHASNAKSVSLSWATRSFTLPAALPGWLIPARSPLTSAIKTGTPMRLKASAIRCRVTVLPVPVAPAMRP